MKKVSLILLSLLVGAVSVLSAAPAKAATTNLIANPSMEAATKAGQPKTWKTDSWGTNTPVFDYLNTGHTGSRSLKVSISGYTNGDAKWFFTPVAVTAGQKYVFSDYYQSDVATDLVLQYTKSGGGKQYVDLGTVAASAAWNQASFEFTVPANITKATVLHLVRSNGSLTIDDASLAVAETTTTPPVDPGTGSNLISNASFETATGSNPDNWTSNAWGTNTPVLTYLNTGHTGTHSVKSQITAYTDGDAKWYFSPVDVTPGKLYSFSDYYQSNTTTEVIVQYTKTDGTFQYVSLGTVPASADWTQANFSFMVPTGVQKLSVFHVLESVGYLTMDDASLVLNDNTSPILNPSVEQAASGDTTRPEYWFTNAWGTNTPQFAYLNEGHTGNRSLKVTVSNFTDGDAKWMPQAQPLEAGKSYTFSAWYKTNTTPHVSAQINLNDGTTTYMNLPVGLPGADAATNWQQYKDTFTMPKNAVSASLFFFLPENGWIQTDDYSITPYTPVGFNAPLLTLTFDDGFEENVNTVLPVLTQYGLKSTQCYATQFADQSPDAILAFRDAGHEICSHTITHPFLTQLTDAQLTTELRDSQLDLQQMTGEPVSDFASPYGDYDARVINEIKKYYRSHRSVDEGYNSKDNFNIYKIRVQNILSTTTAADVQGWIDYAKATNTWLVLVYHRVDTTDVGQFDSYKADFDAQMKVVHDSGITVKTYNDALDDVTAQL